MAKFVYVVTVFHMWDGLDPSSGLCVFEDTQCESSDEHRIKDWILGHDGMDGDGRANTVKDLSLSDLIQKGFDLNSHDTVYVEKRELR